MAIQVAKINETTFKVTVEGRTTTTHTVTVSLDYYKKLTGGRVGRKVVRIPPRARKQHQHPVHLRSSGHSKILPRLRTDDHRGARLRAKVIRRNSASLTC